LGLVCTRTRSPVIHPIIGARRLDVGYPTSFIDETTPWVFGAAQPH